MLRLLLLDAALHAAEGSVHALDEAVLDLLVVLLHLQEEQTCPSPMGHSDWVSLISFWQVCFCVLKVEPQVSSAVSS